MPRSAASCCPPRRIDGDPRRRETVPTVWGSAARALAAAKIKGRDRSTRRLSQWPRRRWAGRLISLESFIYRTPLARTETGALCRNLGGGDPSCKGSSPQCCVPLNQREKSSCCDLVGQETAAEINDIYIFQLAGGDSSWEVFAEAAS